MTLALIILFGIGLALYFLPTMLAAARKHRSVAPIAVINLFLGWTLLGWVLTLAWATSGPNNAEKMETGK